MFQTLEVSGAIVVSTPQKVALADATKAAKMFQLVNIPLLGKGLATNDGAGLCRDSVFTCDPNAQGLLNYYICPLLLFSSRLMKETVYGYCGWAVRHLYSPLFFLK